MEVSLLEADGIPEGCVISIRAGTTQRQASVEANKPCKLSFPIGFALSNPFTVDCLAPLGSTTLEVSRDYDIYPLKMRSRYGNKNMSMTLRILEGSGANSLQSSRCSTPMNGLSVRQQLLAMDARSYLNAHSLLAWMQVLLEDLMQDRPDDPWAYIERSTAKAREAMFGSISSPEPCDPSDFAKPKTGFNDFKSDASLVAKDFAEMGTQTSDVTHDFTEVATQTLDDTNGITELATQTSEVTQDTTDMATQTSEVAHGITDMATQTSEVTHDIMGIATQMPEVIHDITGVATQILEVNAGVEVASTPCQRKDTSPPTSAISPQSGASVADKKYEREVYQDNYVQLRKNPEVDDRARRLTFQKDMVRAELGRLNTTAMLPTQAGALGAHEATRKFMNSAPTLHGDNVEVRRKPEGKPEADGRATRRKFQKEMMRAQLGRVGGSTLADPSNIKFQNEATILRNETTLLAMQSVTDDRAMRRTFQKDMLRAELGKLGSPPTSPGQADTSFADDSRSKFRHDTTLLRSDNAQLRSTSEVDDRALRRTFQKDMLRAELGKLSVLAR